MVQTPENYHLLTIKKLVEKHGLTQKFLERNLNKVCTKILSHKSISEKLRQKYKEETKLLHNNIKLTEGIIKDYVSMLIVSKGLEYLKTHKNSKNLKIIKSFIECNKNLLDETFEDPSEKPVQSPKHVQTPVIQSQYVEPVQTCNSTINNNFGIYTSLNFPNFCPFMQTAIPTSLINNQKVLFG